MARGSKGFTLVEMMISTVLTSFVMMALLVLYRSAALVQGGLLREQPLQESSAYLTRRFMPDVNAATCAMAPPSLNGRGLVLYQGRECDGSLIGPQDRYAVYCIMPAASGQASGVFYANGPWNGLGPPPGTVACSRSFADWKLLTLPSVAADGRFSIVGINQVNIELDLNLHPDHALESPILPVDLTAQLALAAP